MSRKPAAAPQATETESAQDVHATEVPVVASLDAPAADPVTVLRVTAKADGFRRAGLAFGRLPAEIPLDALEPWQVEALKAEPMLTVEEVLL